MEKYTIKETILRFNYEFNEPLDKYYKILSNPKIDTIEFGETFNKEIDHLIPSNIKVIKFGWYTDIKIVDFRFYAAQFNKNVNFLPESIKEIYYGHNKNHSLEELQNLPKSLLKLQVGSKFNQQITENVLPNSLTHLAFGRRFNQKITKNVLPNSLTHLSFGYGFNQQITENVLPSGLTHLDFGSDFNQEITENILPNSLTHLTFGYEFNQELTENVLPDNLKVLKIYYINKDIILKNIDTSKIKFKIEYF